MVVVIMVVVMVMLVVVMVMMVIVIRERKALVILNLWSEACFLHNPSVTALSLSPSSIQTALCIGGCLKSR